MTFSFNLLPQNSVKFRENSADSVVYQLEGHTATEPATLTITRVLPTPRKGNNGTMKVYLNARRTTSITVPGDAGSVIRQVPVICKVETSLPVGADTMVLKQLFSDLSRFMTVNGSADDDQERVFASGLLPDGTGDTSALGPQLVVTP